jgi:uncharacterized protein
VTVDLTDAEIIDDHCHGFEPEALLAVAPKDFETRLTLAGMGYSSSSQTDPDRWEEVRRLTESTTYSLVARRWLAERLGCRPTAASVATARHEAFSDDPIGYIRALLDDAGIVGLLVDEGYPLPPIPAERFERSVGGVPVHRVVRIEQVIAESRDEAASYRDLEAALESELEQAAADPRTVAFKSIIAYRTGLDVRPFGQEDAARAFETWRDEGWAEVRELAKPVRDRLLDLAAAVAARHGLPLHIHTGDGDPDIDLARARPSELFPFLRSHGRQPVVLIHGGHPWSHEAGYIASVLPNVHVDLSVLIPWAGGAVERLLADLIGSVPTAKLLYGSDQASEPEVFWIAARLARRALERVLSAAVEDGDLTAEQGRDIGQAILSRNTRRLHRLGP